MRYSITKQKVFFYKIQTHEMPSNNKCIKLPKSPQIEHVRKATELVREKLCNWTVKGLVRLNSTDNRLITMITLGDFFLNIIR